MAAKKKVKKVAKKAQKKTIKKAVKVKKAKKATPKKAASKKKLLLSSKKAKPAVQSKKSVKKGKSISSTATNLQNFVTPLDDRILVRLSGAEKMTAGGLYIPDTVADVSGNLHGQVLSVGRGHLNPKGHIRPMDVKVGDKVVFADYAGSKIKIQNEDLIILRESEVMGIVSK